MQRYRQLRSGGRMQVIRGDLIALAQDGHFDVIVHGCNCQCTMGAGIAKAIKEAFPEALEADKGTTKGDRNKLGTLSTASIASFRLTTFLYSTVFWLT